MIVEIEVEEPDGSTSMQNVSVHADCVVMAMPVENGTSLLIDCKQRGVQWVRVESSHPETVKMLYAERRMSQALA